MARETKTTLALPKIDLEEKALDVRLRLKGKAAVDLADYQRASGLGSAKPDASVYAEMVRQELRTAIRVCPRLAPLVRDAVMANPASATPEDAARVAAAALEFLPQPERNNDQTAIWGWRKHGIRIVTMMAIALEDPEVHSACSYFGKLATQERGASDLRLNLARILRQKGDLPPAEEPALAAEPELPPLMFAPGAEEAPWPEINAELRRLIKDGAHGSWFNRIGFHGIDDGVISLSTPTGIAADGTVKATK